jgi:hypothetical protein
MADALPEWRFLELFRLPLWPAMPEIASVRGWSACRHCLRARGLLPRVQLIPTEQRAAYHAPRILARLNSDKPARLRPRKGRRLDRRSLLEAKLRRSLIVAKQFALDEHEKVLSKMLDGK